MLAQKIADYVTKETQSQVTAEELLEAVPQLSGFDALAKRVEKTYQATVVALEDEESVDGGLELEELRDDLAEVYQDAVGVQPLPPPIQVPDEDDEDAGVVDE